MIELTLYHGNTESAIDEMIKEKKISNKFKSKGDKHYLGDGFYFYHDLTQAEVWARMKVNRNEKYLGENWAVLECKVIFEDKQFWDLDNRDEQDLYFKEMDRLRSEIEKRNVKIEKYSDAYLCNHISNIIGVDILSKTFVYKDKHKAYPALFSNERKGFYSITKHFRTEKQYVIRSFESVDTKSLRKINSETVV